MSAAQSPSLAAVHSTPTAFLFGFERSGTTLLSMMLGAHPRIAIPLSTAGLWYRCARRLGHYHHLRAPEHVRQLVDDLLQEDRIRLWDTRLDRDEVLTDLETGSYSAVVARFHKLYAVHKGKDLWGNVDIGTLEDMHHAHEWFPALRFVHIVRDGRDVAVSHRTYPYGAANVAECAERWDRLLQVNLRMGAILGSDHYLVVRYEDLILDTETTLRRISAFLGVDYAPEMLRYTEMVDDKIPADRRFLWPIINQPPDASKIGRWRAEMREAERAVFERVANGMLRELGYDAYNEVPAGMRVHALELWYFLDQGGRLRRLAERLGVRRPAPALDRNEPGPVSRALP